MLDVDALADYTKGRLDAGDEETQRILDRSLTEVRRWCGWHVTPTLAVTVTVDGPGGQLLRLPTLQVVELNTVTDDGVQVDPADLEWSRIGLVCKKNGANWSHRLSGITVSMTHGFDEALDFEAAVLSVADRRSQVLAVDSPIAIGPFRFGENRTTSAATPAFTASELSILQRYRLDWHP